MRLANCVLLCSSLLFSHAAAAAELPQRWVSSGGSLSEWVVRLGGEGRLVGVDTTSLHPQSLRQLPSVGYQRALSAEGVLSLRPDILIGSEEMGPPPVVAQIAKVEFNQAVDQAAPVGVECRLAGGGERYDGAEARARTALEGGQRRGGDPRVAAEVGLHRWQRQAFFFELERTVESPSQVEAAVGQALDGVVDVGAAEPHAYRGEEHPHRAGCRPDARRPPNAGSAWSSTHPPRRCTAPASGA